MASKTLDSIASQLPEDAVASMRAEIRALEAGPAETSSAPEIAAGQQVPAARVGTGSLGRAGAVTWETQEHVAVDAATAEHAPQGDGHGALAVKDSLRCWEGECVYVCASVCLVETLAHTAARTLFIFQGPCASSTSTLQPTHQLLHHASS